MNIMFMTKFPNGKQTMFERKINKCFDLTPTRREMMEMMVSGTINSVRSKLHTIRQSTRIKKGMKLSMRHWSGKPYRSKQIEFETAICKSTQSIIIFRVHGKLRVWIDDKLLSDEVVSQLAINDGFDSVEEFIEYFKKGFIGQIIHWTDLLY